MKHCTKCGAMKPLGAFHRNAGTADGRQRWCKACRSEYLRAARRRAGQRPRKLYPGLKDRGWVEQKVLRDLLPTTEIADLLGCRPGTVRAAVRDLRISIPPAAVRETLRAGQEVRA